ncbi:MULTISPECIES: hypothetical protein [unclassified Paenibacillus]|uniref:hypothetical protein n=1 Tax=unclassified Paenibacillus TaxID=185978 RepID=UPI002F3E7226
MSINRRIVTDRDFEEAVQRQQSIRVFQNDHIIDNKTLIIRFDEQLVVTQSDYSDVTYHNRNECEFFVLRR